MKLYTNIRKWRWILLGIAVAIIIGSLWYTNMLVRKIKIEEVLKVRIWAEAIERRVGLVNYTDDYFEKLKIVERESVRLWSEAIKQKSSLVNYTNTFFNKIGNEERKRVALWAEANRIVSIADTGQELSFYLQILAENTTIPIVITDEEGNIRTAANVDFDVSKVKKLTGGLKKEFTDFAPIVSDNFGLINVIYYKESKLYTELRDMLDELSESFISDIVINSASVPVLITDTSKTKIIAHGNLDKADVTKENLPALIDNMEKDNPPIEIIVTGRTPGLVFYENSRFYNTLKEIIDNHVQKFLEEVVSNTAVVPVIITDSTYSRVVAHSGGVDSSEFNTSEKLSTLLKKMASHNPPMEINLPIQGKRHIFFKESAMLNQIRYYPIIQFVIIGFFIFAIYILLNITRRSEQDQVWAGMARETAHQLGTPISSLLAWVELLKNKVKVEDATEEISKDVNRLEAIAERFSKIGSKPEMQLQCLYDVIMESVDYMRVRTSNKITYTIYANNDMKKSLVPVNKNLFQWVIENMLRNGVDAIEGEGVIAISVFDAGKNIFVDVEDTGRGIPKSKAKVIFTPGYSTKKRGWGLGLTLSERIIAKYHNGKIFVKASIPDKGTIFRIVLNK